jgi:hypothetical protein
VMINNDYIKKNEVFRFCSKALFMPKIRNTEHSMWIFAQTQLALSAPFPQPRE